MKKLTATFVVAAMLLATPAVHARMLKKLVIVAAVVVGAKAMAKNKKDKNEQAKNNGQNGQNGQNDKNRRDQ